MASQDGVARLFREFGAAAGKEDMVMEADDVEEKEGEVSETNAYDYEGYEVGDEGYVYEVDDDAGGDSYDDAHEDVDGDSRGQVPASVKPKAEL